MKKEKVYHNTTNLTGDLLLEATENASGLKSLLHNLFKQFPEPKTPFQVSVILIKNGFKYPITSIRARMTALTKESILIMSQDANVPGDYRWPNHTWKLSDHSLNSTPADVVLENK